MLLAVLLLAQAIWTASPDSATVGDTVYLTRTLPAPPGARLRAQSLSRTSVMEPLRDPVLIPRGNTVLLQYAVALFEPGRHTLAMPPVELIQPDGLTETISGDTARFTVRSVLPASDSLPPPRPSRGPLPRGLRQGLIVLALVLVVALAGVAWAVLRRRVRPRPEPTGSRMRVAPPPLARWMEDGELRAVASVAAERLRRAIARAEPRAHLALAPEERIAVLQQHRPEWPLDEVADVLRALERARFAPVVPGDVLAIAEQAAMLIEALEPASRGA